MRPQHTAPLQGKESSCGEEMTGYSVLIFSASSALEVTVRTQHRNTVGECVLNETYH